MCRGWNLVVETGITGGGGPWCRGRGPGGRASRRGDGLSQKLPSAIQGPETEPPGVTPTRPPLPREAEVGEREDEVAGRIDADAGESATGREDQGAVGGIIVREAGGLAEEGVVLLEMLAKVAPRNVAWNSVVSSALLMTENVPSRLKTWTKRVPNEIIW